MVCGQGLRFDRFPLITFNRDKNLARMRISITKDVVTEERTRCEYYFDNSTIWETKNITIFVFKYEYHIKVNNNFVNCSRVPHTAYTNIIRTCKFGSNTEDIIINADITDFKLQFYSTLPPPFTTSPTNNPSSIPTAPSENPSTIPTSNPSTIPTSNPSTLPTSNPSTPPTSNPTMSPSVNFVSVNDTNVPTNSPSINIPNKVDPKQITVLTMIIIIVAVLALCLFIIVIILWLRSRQIKAHLTDLRSNNKSLSTSPSKSGAQGIAMPQSISVEQRLARIQSTSIKSDTLGNRDDDNDGEMDDAIEGVLNEGINTKTDNSVDSNVDDLYAIDTTSGTRTTHGNPNDAV